jgi:hypothetical protein
VANESNFSLKKVSLVKETVQGEFQTSPKLYNVGVMAISLAPTQKTEQNTEMAQDGQATAMDTGSLDFAGNMNFKMKTSLVPIILHSVAGKSTKADATLDTWTASTTYLAPANKYSSGQVVNHSDGLHSLVVKAVSGTGTSGATEPDLTGKNEYDTVVDNEITWIVRDKLHKHTGATDQDMQSIGVICEDYSAQNGGSTFMQYFSGNFFNSFQTGKSNGDIVFKNDIPTVGIGYRDNTQDDWQNITPSSEVEIKDRPYSFDDMKVEVNGVQPESASEFTLTLNRNVAVEDEVKQGSKDFNVPVLTMDGNLRLKFTKEEWAKAFANTTSEVVITYENRTGDKVILTFPQVKFMLGTIEKSTDAFTYVSVPLSPSGTVNQKTMTYEVVSSSDW